METSKSTEEDCLSVGLVVRSKISVLVFPTRNTPESQNWFGYGVIYEPEEWNNQITSTGRPSHFLWDKIGINCGIKPGRLRAISPFGGVARSQARESRTRKETHVRGVGKAFAARSRVFSRLLGWINNRACNIWTAVILNKLVDTSYMIAIVYRQPSS